jgi:hypothetical protein
MQRFIIKNFNVMLKYFIYFLSISTQPNIIIMLIVTFLSLSPPCLHENKIIGLYAGFLFSSILDGSSISL